MITSFILLKIFQNDLFDQFDNNYISYLYYHYIFETNNDLIVDYFVGDSVL